MPTYPTGTVTFLFTDIEGSTQRWEKYPELMQRAFKRQEQIIREAVAKHGGYAYKMIGDAFQIAFAAAPAALNAAIDAQRALNAENWGSGEASPSTRSHRSDDGIKPSGISKGRGFEDASPLQIRVRMALHTGVTEERGDDQGHLGDYVGPVLNRAARVLSAGYGAQILLTEATATLVRDVLPPDTTLRDLGEKRLRDLARAEHVYQLVAPDLPSEFPPLKTLDAFPNNVPGQLTNFIGRDKEIAEVRRIMADVRFLTLTGAGGCGKTRLALQVAAEVLENFPDGVWFVELAPLADPALVVQGVASTFALQEQKGTSLENILKDYLREKNLLLILDNCEHLIAACAKFADTFLHACPKLKILASSREALGVTGETTYRIPSLSMPDVKHLPATESLAQYDAVRLFTDRALMGLPSFQVTNQNAPAVAQICHRLDGIPLALELAASRVKGMKVEQIVQRLDDRFRLLTGGSRTALPRQQTLRATIDWSYALLSGPERVLLRRLSVFAGGWTLEAAEAVCADPSPSSPSLLGKGDGGLGRDEVLDLLLRLIDKSLVVMEEEGGSEAARYRMLETLRQYARDKLLESGEGERIRDRHLEYFMNFAEQAEPKLHGPEQFQWVDRLDLEYDNLRAALEWSLGEARGEKGLRLAAALTWFWDMRGYWSEGRERVEALLRRPESAQKTMARANALLAAAEMTLWLSDVKAQRQYLEESIAIAREQGEAGKRSLALGLARLGNRLASDDPGKAHSLHEEGLTIAQSLGDRWILAFFLFSMGRRFVSQRDVPAAVKAFEESMRLFRSVGDKSRAAVSSGRIGTVYLRQRDYASARLRLEQELLFFREVKLRRDILSALTPLGEIARVEGNYALAKTYYTEGLAIARELGSKFYIAMEQNNLGFVALQEGDPSQARRFFAENLALVQEFESKAGMHFTLHGFASVAAVQEQPRRAVRLFAAAELLSESMDYETVSPADSIEYERYLAVARAQLNEASFNAAWAEGRALTLEQAIEYALKEESKNG